MDTDENIQTAAGDGNIEFVRAALASGVHPNTPDGQGYTAMHAAVSYGHAELLRVLLEAGGDPNITDLDGDTPLHVCEDDECARVLLAAGATFNAANREGRTPIEAAAAEGQLGMVQLLSQVYQDAGVPIPELPTPYDDSDEDGSDMDADEAMD